MDTTEFERRLRRLALREGMTFATLIGLGESDQAVMRSTILAGFDTGAVYTEREVNERLKAWLAGAGSMIETDHANLRRWLVDTQVLGRTAYCADYHVAPGVTSSVSVAAAALDAPAIVVETRRDDAARRAARKAAWLARAAGGGYAGAA